MSSSVLSITDQADSRDQTFIIHLSTSTNIFVFFLFLSGITIIYCEQLHVTKFE